MPHVTELQPMPRYSEADASIQWAAALRAKQAAAIAEAETVPMTSRYWDYLIARAAQAGTEAAAVEAWLLTLDREF